jgi:putative endopeptidase
MKLTNCLCLAILFIWLIACRHQSGGSSFATREPAVFIDKSAMDTTTSPGENFFLYANGNWLNKTQIPKSESGWGTFYILWESNENKIHSILTEAATHDDTIGSIEQKVGDFFTSGMDTAAIERVGYNPLKPQLVKINAVKDYKGLVKLAADGFKAGNGFLFNFYVSPDDRNSAINRAHFDETGLELPNRDYYFKEDSASKKIRAAYKKYIIKIFTLIGVDAARAVKKADAVFKLETMIASAHLTPVELRDAVKSYHKFRVSDFQKQIPDIDLVDAFRRIGLKTDTILVGQPGYYQALDHLLKTRSMTTWKDKSTFDAVSNAAESLSKEFRDARFAFFNNVLYGQKVQRERWKIIAENVDGKLGDLLGQLYVHRYFPPAAKQRMLALVNNLQKTYRERMQKLDWMSDSTKKRAIAKLNAMTKKIGYPDKWRNYDDVSISKYAYFQNQQSIAKHNFQIIIGKIDQPVDRLEWNLTPPTIDAYYSTSSNEIIFPAGILQFPFFDQDADDAINYGAIGLVIGHEMTHGFDDQGRQYDRDGNLNDWWTKEDAAQFKMRVQLVIDQYNRYTVLNNIHLNGVLTQGENLADIGGLAIAYEAFKNTAQGKSNTKIDGLTPDQRFFLATARVLRSKWSDEALRASISNNQHSPPMYRLNGPVSNMPAFYKAFNVKPSDSMYRVEKERVMIW